jgi:hypothetical protein
VTRLAVACALVIGSAGCAGVPAAVAWSTAGAGLGATAAALKFDDDLFNYFVASKPRAPQTEENAP